MKHSLAMKNMSHEGTPTDSDASPAQKQNGAEEAGTGFNFDWQAFQPIAVGKWRATLRCINFQVTHLLHFIAPG